MLKFVKSRSFNDQLNKIFLIRLMVAGMLVVFMAVCLHFLSLAFYEKFLVSHVQGEVTQLFNQSELLEKALNQELERQANSEADKVYHSFVADNGLVETNVLYRLINEKDQVVQSNYQENLPKAFTANPSLYESFVGSVDLYNQGHLNSLHSALRENKSVIYPVAFLNPQDKGDFILYKPYEGQVVIEIVMSKTMEKERIVSFFHEQLNHIYESKKLENLKIYNHNGTLYVRGSQVDNNVYNGSKVDSHETIVTLTYENQPLFIRYSIGSGASEVIKVEYILWVMAFYLLAAIVVYMLLKRGSKAILDPIDMFLNSAKEARLGFYDKRLDLLDHMGFKPLSIGFNAMLDHMEKLLEDKKVQEDLLRQLHITEQQLEEIENIGLDEAFCVEARLKQTTQQISDLYTQLLMTLCSAIEAKDQYTDGHCQRVLEWSIKLGEHCGLVGQDLEDIKMGALLHDVGKLGLPEELLNKLEPLTEYEWSVLKRHTRFGEEILADFNVTDATKKIVAMHHEHYDGKGYPKGEMGHDIPIGARIVCLVDAYDAMVNSRPYRLIPMGFEEMIKELKSQSAKQFDPDLVEVFIQMIGYQGGAADET